MKKKQRFALALMNEIYDPCLMCDEENREAVARVLTEDRKPSRVDPPTPIRLLPLRPRPSKAAEAQKQIIF